MRWIKKGVIFSLPDNLPWAKTHAAMPIAYPLENDKYRIYFSPRDDFGRSRLGYFEIDIHAPDRILCVSKDALLFEGPPGAFDDSGVMASWITKHAGQEYFYYIGWNRAVTVPFRNSIGLAVSTDGGKSFNKCFEGPILDRCITDPYFTASCCTLIEESLWRMWYVSCAQWKIVEGRPKHYYHIKYAESDDGIRWRRNNTVCIDFQSGDEYAISRPCVLKEDGLYKMWYSFRGTSYRIGYAESEDGVHWRRKDDQVGMGPSESGWDSEMIEYPYVFRHQKQLYMLYNGNDYGGSGVGMAIFSED